MPLKGNAPQSMAYKSTPDAQISVGGPMYSFFMHISGHMYDGVPQKIFSFTSGEEQQQKPKSINLIDPFLSMIMFSSLMSLWVTFLEWRYDRIYRSWEIIFFAFSSENCLLGCALRWACRLSPCTFSMTRYTYWLVSIASYSFTIPLWFSLLKIRISLTACFLRWMSISFSLSYCFIATFSPDGLCRHSLTTA